MKWVFVIWRTVIILFAMSDFYMDYIRLYFIMQPKINSHQFLDVTYWFAGVNFSVLSVLIIWQTIQIIRLIKVMGSSLEKERSRIRFIMIVFSFSYLGTSAYYITQVST